MSDQGRLDDPPAESLGQIWLADCRQSLADAVARKRERDAATLDRPEP
jgi:hypothetical protein